MLLLLLDAVLRCTGREGVVVAGQLLVELVTVERVATAVGLLRLLEPAVGVDKGEE